MVFGEFEGAEIVLCNSGLVAQVQSADLCIFLSAKETHLNLHIKGARRLRGSLVIHSDRYMKNGMNGWEGPHVH